MKICALLEVGSWKAVKLVSLPSILVCSKLRNVRKLALPSELYAAWKDSVSRSEKSTSIVGGVKATRKGFAAMEISYNNMWLILYDYYNSV